MALNLQDFLVALIRVNCEYIETFHSLLLVLIFSHSYFFSPVMNPKARLGGSFQAFACCDSRTFPTHHLTSQSASLSAPSHPDLMRSEFCPGTKQLAS